MRILIAEDERELSNALKAILNNSNFSVDQAFNGEEAIDYIELGEYDGIILDIMMPKIDGIEVLKIIRNKGINTPVIMLTAKSEVEDKVRGLDCGADDYLTKPFDIKELIARIRAITRRNSENKDNILRFGNTELDRSSFELRAKSGTEVLSNKEFQIMEILLFNPNNIVSAERLLEKIWGYDTDTEINAIWVYISNIRKKLKKLDSNIVIRGIRNNGYKLEIKE
ncbi:MAG: response regulator transcription factor [Andreesenia angusta]|nr:response regulator transcription factor [Andreesenia angusta]